MACTVNSGDPDSTPETATLPPTNTIAEAPASIPAIPESAAAALVETGSEGKCGGRTVRTMLPCSCLRGPANRTTDRARRWTNDEGGCGNGLPRTGRDVRAGPGTDELADRGPTRRRH